MNCISCHNPHETTIYSQGLGIRTPCENCHLENAEVQKIASRKHAECVDCHMPRITKSALGDPERHTGDLRTHLMLVWPFDTAQFSEDGSTANPYVALDFSCKGCHYDGGPASVVPDEELIEFAIGYHERESAGSAD